MEKYTVAYSRDDVAAKKIVNKLYYSLKDAFEYVDDLSDSKRVLREARFLVVVFSSAAQINDLSIKNAYEYFLNEIVWKRKPAGNIVIITAKNVVIKHMPYKLKNLRDYNDEELSNLIPYFNYHLKPKTTASKRQMPARKEIKYVPHDTAVKQITFSARAPHVESFERGNLPPAGSADRETSGCKTDHIPGVTAPHHNTNGSSQKNIQSAQNRPHTYKPHIEEELSRSTPVSKDVNPNKPPKTKTSSFGCFATILLIIIAVIVAVVIIVSAGNQISSEFSISTGNIVEKNNELFSSLNIKELLKPLNYVKI